MSRIEMAFSEYNALKFRIKTLEQSLIDASKELEAYKEKMDDIKEAFEDLEDETLSNRLFHWKSIIKPLKDKLYGTTSL